MSISTTTLSLSLFHHHVRIARPCTFLSCRAPSTPSPSSRLLCSATASGSNSGKSKSLGGSGRNNDGSEKSSAGSAKSPGGFPSETLLSEISILRLRIQQLESESERRDSLSDSLSQIGADLNFSTEFTDNYSVKY